MRIELTRKNMDFLMNEVRREDNTPNLTLNMLLKELRHYRSLQNDGSE